MRKNTFRKWQAEKLETKAHAHLDKYAPSAIHEAGHALANELLLNGVEYAELRDNLLIEKQVTVRSGKQFSSAISTGFTRTRAFRLATVDNLERVCVAILAGPAAEEILTGKRPGDEGDIADMTWHVENFN